MRISADQLLHILLTEYHSSCVAESQTMSPTVAVGLLSPPNNISRVRALLEEKEEILVSLDTQITSGAIKIDNKLERILLILFSFFPDERSKLSPLSFRAAGFVDIVYEQISVELDYVVSLMNQPVPMVPGVNSRNLIHKGSLLALIDHSIEWGMPLNYQEAMLNGVVAKFTHAPPALLLAIFKASSDVASEKRIDLIYRLLDSYGVHSVFPTIEFLEILKTIAASLPLDKKTRISFALAEAFKKMKYTDLLDPADPNKKISSLWKWVSLIKELQQVGYSIENILTSLGTCAGKWRGGKLLLLFLSYQFENPSFLEGVQEDAFLDDVPIGCLGQLSWLVDAMPLEELLGFVPACPENICGIEFFSYLWTALPLVHQQDILRKAQKINKDVRRMNIAPELRGAINKHEEWNNFATQIDELEKADSTQQMGKLQQFTDSEQFQKTLSELVGLRMISSFSTLLTKLFSVLKTEDLKKKLQKVIISIISANFSANPDMKKKLELLRFLPPCYDQVHIFLRRNIFEYVIGSCENETLDHDLYNKELFEVCHAIGRPVKKLLSEAECLSYSGRLKKILTAKEGAVTNISTHRKMLTLQILYDLEGNIDEYKSDELLPQVFPHSPFMAPISVLERMLRIAVILSDSVPLEEDLVQRCEQHVLLVVSENPCSEEVVSLYLKFMSNQYLRQPILPEKRETHDKKLLVILQQMSFRHTFRFSPFISGILEKLSPQSAFTGFADHLLDKTGRWRMVALQYCLNKLRGSIVGTYVAKDMSDIVSQYACS